MPPPPQVLLAFVSNITGEHTRYSQNNVNMIITDVMAVTVFLFSTLAVNSTCWCTGRVGHLFILCLPVLCPSCLLLDQSGALNSHS